MFPEKESVFLPFPFLDKAQFCRKKTSGTDRALIGHRSGTDRALIAHWAGTHLSSNLLLRCLFVVQWVEMAGPYSACFDQDYHRRTSIVFLLPSFDVLLQCPLSSLPAWPAASPNKHAATDSFLPLCLLIVPNKPFSLTITHEKTETNWFRRQRLSSIVSPSFPSLQCCITFHNGETWQPDVLVVLRAFLQH